MENLAKGFVYPITLAWAGTEVLMMASQGTAWPLGVGFLLFAVGFVVVGCYPMEDRSVDRAGRLFFAVVALACMVFALRTFSTAPVAGTLKSIAAAVLCFIALGPAKSQHESHGH